MTLGPLNSTTGGMAAEAAAKPIRNSADKMGDQRILPFFCPFPAPLPLPSSLAMVS